MPAFCCSYLRAADKPLLGEAISGLDQFVRDAGLKCGVSGIGNDAQVGLWPRSMQVPRAACRADNIVATLHDDRGNLR